MSTKELLLVFCVDPNEDPVSKRVLDQFLEIYDIGETDLEVDGRKILKVTQDRGNFYLMQLDKVLSHAYERYAPFINGNFPNVEAVLIMNWHQGDKAPSSIFTVQTIGDMQAGVFSPVDPRLTRALFLAIEKARVNRELSDFTTWMEATHWSGVIYGNQPGENVRLIQPSVIDVEIGSYPEDWSNPEAVSVMAHAFQYVFEDWDKPVFSLFCMGGVHFDAAFTAAVQEFGASHGVSVSHILPNQWLVSEHYDQRERFDDVLQCYESIQGGVALIVFHDKLKGVYKDHARRLGELKQIPVISHKKLKSYIEQQIGNPESTRCCGLI